MNPKVIIAEPLTNHRLRLRFENGEIREFDVAPYLDKGIFRELKDDAYFRRVRVAFGSVEWPNEQDFSKDTLYMLGTPSGT